MAGLNTVTSLGGYHIAEYLNKMALPIFHENTIFSKCIDDMYTLPNNESSTMKWYKPSKFDEFPELTEGVTPDGQDYSESTITKALSWYGSWSGITDIVKMTYNTPVLQNIDRELMYAANKTYDSLIRIEALTCTNLGGTSSSALISSYGGTVASVGGQVTLGIYREIANTMREAGALPYYNYEMGSTRVGSEAAWDAYLCIAPIQLRSTILSTTGFLEAKDYPNGSPAKDELGAIDRFRVFESDNIPTVGTSVNSLAVYPMFFFGRNAMGGVKIGGGGMMTYFDDFGSGQDILRQRAALGRKFQAAFNILEDSWMYVLYVEQYV